MPVAQWTERCPATAAAAGIPAGRVTRGRSSVRESTGLPPRRGPFEPGRPLQAPEARGVTGSMASYNLAGPGSNPGGPAHERPSRARSGSADRRRETTVCPRAPAAQRAVNLNKEGGEMHLHLVRVAARPKPVPRPKVVRLEDRRKARLESARSDRPPPRRPAA